MRILPLLASAAALAFPATAFAQQPTSADEDGDWSGSYGGAVLVRSAYEGGEDIEFTPIPYFDVTYKDRVFVQPPLGIGVHLVNNDRVRLSGGVGYAFGRDEDDGARLQGLGDLDGGVAPFASGRVNLTYAVLDATVRVPVSGDLEGARLNASLSTRLPAGDRLEIYPGIAITAGTDDFNASYFGIDNAQSLSSGLPAYEASSGITSAGLQVFSRYDLGGNWNIVGLASWQQLTGDAKDSPIVEDDKTVFALVGLTREF